MFIQHNIKKIRNNIRKSNKSGKPCCLKIKGKNVTWQQFKDAFNWDQKTCSLPLHETQHNTLSWIRLPKRETIWLRMF